MTRKLRRGESIKKIHLISRLTVHQPVVLDLHQLFSWHKSEKSQGEGKKEIGSWHVQLLPNPPFLPQTALCQVPALIFPQSAHEPPLLSPNLLWYRVSCLFDLHMPLSVICSSGPIVMCIFYNTIALALAVEDLENFHLKHLLRLGCLQHFL